MNGASLPMDARPPLGASPVTPVAASSAHRADSEPLRPIKPRAHQSLVWLTVGVLLLIALVWVADRLMRPTAYGFEQILVEGRIQHTDTNALLDDLHAALGGNYFAVDMGKVEGVMARYPWVSAFSVRKKWPNSLYVMLEEHQPVARWRASPATAGGEAATLWLNSTGQVIDLGDAPSTRAYRERVPVLVGAGDHAQEIWATLQRWNPRLNRLGLQLASLTLSPGKTWTAQVVELGAGLSAAARQADQAGTQFEIKLLAENADQQLQVALAALRGHLHSRWSALERLDLRYHHGFAVKWRAHSLPGGNTP